MFRKTIISAVIASTFSLSGCLDDTPDTGKNAGSVTNPVDSSTYGVFPVFSPAEGKLPLPNDLIIQQPNAALGIEADGTYAVSDTTPPVTTALNELSGASTTAPIDIAMSGLIDASSVIGPEDGDLPNQNVFLVELTYASGEPVRGLSISEPPIPANPVVAGVFGLGSTQPDYSIEVIELDGVSTIRINPEEPLDPNTRYVVAITNSVTDVNGDPIVQSPGAGGYASVSDPATVLTGTLASFASIQALATRLWEPTSLAYINNVDPGGGIGPLRGTDPAAPVTDSNLAITYSFTTSNDAKVLTYMADPAQWVADTIKSSVALTAAGTEVATNPSASFGTVAPAVLAAIGGYDGSSIIPGCTPSAPPNTAFSCVGTNLLASLKVGAVPGVPAQTFPDAAARTVAIDTAGIKDARQVSALISPVLATADAITVNPISVAQGTIELPYYLDEPGPGGAGLVTGSWEADSALATVLGGVLGSNFPQRDADISTAVNGIFPFPEQKSTQTVPMLAIFPTSNGSGVEKTIIFQHGITTDRSAALAIGSAIVASAKLQGQDVAVIAIDQPLHGISGFSAADQATLAEQLAAAGGLLGSADGDNDGSDTDAADQAIIDAIVAGLYSAGVVQGVDTATNSGGAATNCIDLATNGLSASTTTILLGGCDADPVVTGALGGKTASAAVGGALVLESTVANGGSTIAGLGVASATERHFGFTADANAAPTAMDFDGDKAANGSGSLFINLGNFLASRDNLRQGTMDLLNLRASLDGLDLDGAGAILTADNTSTFFIGHSLGTVNGIPFVRATQDTTTTADDLVAANFLTPGGMVTRLIESSPQFGPTIIGGLGAQGVYQDSSSFQAFLNVLQATADSADAINFVDDLTVPSLFSVVIGDTTIPNDVTTNIDIVPSLPGTSSIAPLAGSEPLVDVSGAAATVVAAGTNTDLNANNGVVRYTAGSATHGTPVYPSAGTDAAAFAEMVGQATSLVVNADGTVDAGASAPIE
jgi:Bacterial Ig-like domain